MSRYAIVRRYFIPAYINLKSIAFKKFTSCRSQLLQERGLLPTSRIMLIRKLSRPSVTLSVYIPVERFTRNTLQIPFKHQVPLAKYPGFRGFIASNDIKVFYTKPDTPGTNKLSGEERRVGRLDAASEAGYFQRINMAKMNQIKKLLKNKEIAEKPPQPQDKKTDE